MRDLLDLTGKTAFVTGASSGLGAHFAQLLAKAVAAVTIAARRQKALEALASQIRATGGVCTVTALDISDANSIAAAEPLLAGVDILINNAGIARQAALLHHSQADRDAVVNPTVQGMFQLTHLAGKARRGQGGKSDGRRRGMESVMKR